ncbi:protein FAM47E [Lepisosteus oculatus]|uniref:protein FAM47E n=1 Tax=Lepisosteus oculatus TaxID=7918 RepID=UPI000740144B|nr:PREDICTED: protein FAM47E [Lepisosteus oculatus]
MSGTRLFPVAQSESTVRRHPWYKERLKTKYLKETKNKQQLSGALNSHCWLFLKPGLDDVRDGYPPPVGDENFTRPQKGPVPVIHGAEPSFSTSEKMPRKRFSKQQVCFSKLTPMQQARREHIAEVEYGLTQHPLALYPHLEEGMCPELLDKVVDVLDPEMHLTNELGSCTPDLEEKNEEDSSSQCERMNLNPSGSNLSTRHSTSVMTDDSKQKNPYKWLPLKEDSTKDDGKVKVKRLPSPSHDEDIKKVTKEFCDWVVSLGGESNNIDEPTLVSLFGSGYEIKPPFTVPIQVVELNSVPAELRMSVEELPRETASETKFSRDIKAEKTSCGVKIKYGAWYLDPKTWKKRNADEPLEDPKIISEEKQFSMNQPSEKDEELKQMHGTLAFKQFILNKGMREPMFLQKLFTQEDEKEKFQKDSNKANRNGPGALGSTATHARPASYL